MASSGRSLTLQSLCIAHAAACSVLWYLVIYQDNYVITVRMWAMLCVIWLAWIAVPIFQSSQRRKWLVAIGLGLVALLPTFGTLYSFAAWSIGGFAP